MNTKIKKIAQTLNEQGVAMTFITDPITIFYLTGVEMDPFERIAGLMIFPDDEPHFFTPALEVEMTKSKVDFPVTGYQDAENPWQKIASLVSGKTIKKIAVEFSHITMAKIDGLKSVFQADFIDLTPLINRMRLIKTPDEIEKLIIAGQGADECFEAGFNAAKNHDTTETAIAEVIEKTMKANPNGFSGMSFETIVLTGGRAANPHGFPENVKLEQNKLLLFDLGVWYKGYASDATRTISIGRPNDFDQEIHKIVLEAQLTAQEYVKPGVTAESIDKVARDIITKAGYGEYFNHRLGHGLGMGEHEFPSIVEGEKLVIEPGMCFSIEPGIYIPDKVGVRIEDCIYVTETGSESFTHTSKELMIY